MRSSSFSLFIISLFTLNSYFVKATINHKLSKKQSPQRLYRDFGLSPVLDANIVGDNDLSINAPNSFEKPFHFPASVGKYETDDSVGTNAQDLGHYAGYYKLTNTKGARWFYYFFKSAKNDRNGPVVVWLTGGPGCSSSIALFYENGPFKLTKNLSLVPNEYSWSKESNIIYIDQPTGTGFSYTTDEADIRHTSEEAGLDFYNFIQTFFEKHPEYQRNDFYIMGESYAGHFIPAFAAEIQKGNRNSKQGRNNIYINLKYYDIRKKCVGDLCYDFSDMESFLNQTSVKKALGVDERTPFVSCSDVVYNEMSGDIMKNLGVYVPGLLQDGIKVLIYAGEYDLICNWLGNSMWVEGMKWFGQRGFNSAIITMFRVDGENAGWYKSYGNLTFLKVKDAGHMVPMDQPKASLEMLKRWTNGIHL